MGRVDDWYQERLNIKKNMKFLWLIFSLAAVICTTESKPAIAYPVFAQQAYANPREATGRIVCSNCHLAQKSIDIEVPQSVLPDKVFEAVVRMPYEKAYDKQVLSSGSLSTINVGSLVILPDGFKIAPKQRFSTANKERTKSVLIQPWSKAKPNILVVGPIAHTSNSEIVFPIVSPDPSVDKKAHFLNYSIYAAGNRGRGQLYPDGKSAASAFVTLPKKGTIKDIGQGRGSGKLSTDRATRRVLFRSDEGIYTSYKIKKGLSLGVNVGETLLPGKSLVRVGLNTPAGFGQTETTLVLQNPTRVKGLIAYFFSVWLLQVFLVLKKKQFERVQIAEANF
jgi:apocytochrome f